MTRCRVETAAMLECLEQLPALVLDVQGAPVREFDLDVALKRRPSLILVDELAHLTCGCAASQALVGRRKDHCQRTQRLHDAEHAAHREPQQGLAIEPMQVAYFVSRERVVPRSRARGPRLWRDKLFSTMARNAGDVTDFFNIPANQVVELGTRVEV